MAITRLDPFREFATLQDRMNRLFGDIYLRDEEVTGRPSWIPAVDIYETDGHDLVVKAELPDLVREDIEVTVENNTLTIRGERKFPSEIKADMAEITKLLPQSRKEERDRRGLVAAYAADLCLLGRGAEIGNEGQA